MSEKTYVYPFTAIVGQNAMKEGIILNLVDPSIGGVLIRGQKGTAKTTAVRAVPDLVRGMRVVELPMNATEDRVAGTLDFETAVKTGEKKFEPGILYEADGAILYADEINLLDDHIVDLLLDAAATGRNTVEREGISYSHPSRFILVGTMNPEEGSLRPQLLDRFGLVADIEGEQGLEDRIKIIENRLAFEKDPAKFLRRYSRKQRELERKITAARAMLPEVTVSSDMLRLAAEIGLVYGTQGHRADICMIKAAKAEAALGGRTEVTKEDLRKAAELVLPHRMRRDPLESGRMDPAPLEEAFSKDAGDSGDSGEDG